MSETTNKTAITPTLWLDEGIPVVRAGRGEMLARGWSLAEGTRRENADYIRTVLGTDQRIRINGRLY